ncbi:hypothetical protein IWX90DRAFT_206624 [Phyllosticta citrichinensis]|uniref:Uncharacterized protein n=1 Tax=Phyllosticta citrichinensis TaxID=1130410 RepID=A0ABR1XSI6_9PEZI
MRVLFVVLCILSLRLFPSIAWTAWWNQSSEAWQRDSASLQYLDRAEARTESEVLRWERAGLRDPSFSDAGFSISFIFLFLLFIFVSCRLFASGPGSVLHSLNCLGKRHAVSVEVGH